MKKAKILVCLLLAFCLCLCMVLASCKPEPEAPAPEEEVEGPKGQLHLTPGDGGSAQPELGNPQLPGYTPRVD